MKAEAMFVGSTCNQESLYEERCLDPEEEKLPPQVPKGVCKVHLKDTKESETIGFIPGSVEPSSAAQTCNPCVSPRSCRTFVCSVLTCGLYQLCQRSVLASCLAPKDTSPEEPESVSLQARNSGNHKEEAEQTDTPQTFYDIFIGGVKVDSLKEIMETDTISQSYIPPSVIQTKPSYQSLHDSMQFDDWEVGEEDVDSLITKKLLELYSEYQIEELARCTSDSVFLKKSKTINQLINSLAEEHQMNEQEAENRLVRGIIRISTRKSPKKRPPVSRTFSDSGNETMNGSSSFTFSNNNDYRSNPNIQISEQTSSDKFAREMWRKNGGHSSVAPSGYSHTETDSISLICSSVRT